MTMHLQVLHIMGDKASPSTSKKDVTAINVSGVEVSQSSKSTNGPKGDFSPKNSLML